MSGFINDYKLYHNISDVNINNINDNLKIFYDI